MTHALLIACGAAETLGALVDGPEIVRFFFAPARGDEGRPRAAEAGDIVLGRIKTAAPALGGAFVDIGADDEAFAPASPKAKSPPEGALAIFRVRRPALGGKGAVLDRDWNRGLSPQRVAALNAEGAPRLLSQSFDAAFFIVRCAQDYGVAEIVIDQPDGQRALAAEGIAAACDDRRAGEVDLEAAIAASLDAEIDLGGGARMTIEETAGGCVVDIDAGGAANAARRPNDKVNERAARRLFRELSRRSIGGRVIVDFLPPSAPSARRKLADLLETQDNGLYERRAGKLSPDGLFDMTAPRRDLSSLERASEPAAKGLLRAGRAARRDWVARRAIAALEARLRRNPRLRLSLDASEDIARAIEDRPEWLARLADRYGARMTIAVSASEERRFDVREF